MTAIDLNKPILDLDGKAFPDDATLGKALAAQLAYSGKGNSVKFMDWALSLHRGQSIQVDDADYNTLSKFVEESELRAFVKAPILRAMTEAKTKS